MSPTPTLLSGKAVLSGKTAHSGKTVLLVEDEFFIAQEMRHGLELQGVTVLGPASTLGRARQILQDHQGRIDGAILDLRLRDESGLDLADGLIDTGIPLVFVTGYDRGSIPDRYAGVPLCEKPVSADAVIGALFP